MKHVLFVCGRNRLRSPTAEAVFSDYPEIEVASAGIGRDADTPLDADLVEWADIIFVMEKSHREKLTSRFRSALKDTRVICLDIPDKFSYMEPALVGVLKAKVTPLL
ncbi:MAG TPA: low molecular weight protein tyrosine phosphatase family protein [Rhizomicrobium sp.]|nr:low molecular weight protein tyrosine phosphatase family protein [Rhizomicrobium sp.]